MFRFSTLLLLACLGISLSLARSAVAADPPAPAHVDLAQQLFASEEVPVSLPPAPQLLPSQPPDAGGASPEVDPQLLAPVQPGPRTIEDECWSPELSLDFEEPASLLYSQETNATYTMIPAPAQEVGLNTFNFQHVMGVQGLPRFRMTPRFGWNLMDHDPYVPVFAGVNLTDIPPQLYEVAVDFSVILPIDERWSVLASVAPSLFTDFQNTTDGAFRLPSQVVAFYQWSPALTLAGGFVYLDREDITALGYLGFIFGIPGDVWKAELLFPRSRLAYRLARNGRKEHWIYLAQEFLGGASWAMQHSYGLNDVVTYRDEKVLLGYEYINQGRRSGFVEAGYVYDRVLEFQQFGSGGLSSTGVLRLGLSF